MTTATAARSAKLCATTALVPALFAMAAPAAAQSWDGGAGTENWSDAANWNPDGVPIDNRSVTLDQFDRVELTSASANLGFLTIQERANLVARAQLTATRVTLLDSAQLIIALNGSLNGDVEVRGRDAVLSNNTTINGNVFFAPLSSGNARFFNYGVVTGTTTINGGTTEISFNSNFSDTAAFTVNGGLVNVVRSDTIGSFSGRGGTISFGNGTALTVNQSADGTFSGAFTGNGGFNSTYFVKSGAATLTLAGANTTTGARRIEVNQGTLQLQGGFAIGDQNILAIDGGTVKLLNGETIGALVGDDTGVLDLNGQTLRLSGVGTSFTAVSSARLLGAGTFRLAASDLDLQLDGAHDFTGTYQVSAGTLRLDGTGNSAAGLLVDGGTLQLLSDREVAGVTLTDGSITGPGVLTSLTDIDLRAGRVSAVLAGSVQLDKTTAGTVTLTGDNTYTGDTTIGAGTLQVGDGGTTGSLGAGNIVNNGRLAFSRLDGITVSTAISGTGSLIQKGPGTLSLTGANTYSGGTTIEEGALRVASASALGASAGRVVVEDGGMLAFDVGIGSSPVTYGNAITLNGTGVGDRGALWTLSGWTILSGDITLGSAATILADAFLQITGGVNNAGHLLTVRGGGATLIEGPLSGSGGVTVDNGGILGLAGVNTYTGTTTINGGGLGILGGAAISDSGAVVMTGGNFNVGSDETIGSLAGTGGTITGTNTTLKVGGNNQSTTFAGSLLFETTFRTSLALTKVGTGTLTLTGVNTTRGTFRVEGGTLALGSASALSGRSALEIAGGTLDLRSFTNTATNVTLSSGSIAGSTGSALQVSGGYTQTGGTIEAGATVNAATGATTYLSGGTIAGTLNGGNEPTVVDNGSVRVTGRLGLAGVLAVGVEGVGELTIDSGGQASSAIGSIGGFQGAVGTLTVDGAGSRWDVARFIDVGDSGRGSLIISNGGVVTSSFDSIYIGASIIGQGEALVTGSGSLWTHTVDMNVGRAGTGSLTVADGGIVRNRAGEIGVFGPSRGTVLVTGAGSRWENGTVVLVGNQGSGTLTIADGGAVAASGLTIANQNGSKGALIFGAAEGDPATGAGVLESPTITFGAGTGTILFNHTSTDFELASEISGLGSLLHLAGTTNLTGASDGFTGTTEITGGTLLVNGTLGGDVTVTGTGTLGGSGTLGGNVTIGDGGTLAAGNSPGTLTIAGDLDLNAGSISTFELGEAGVVGGANNDLVAVGGNLALNGGTIRIVRGAGFGAGQFTLFTFGSLSGALGNLTLDPIGGGFVGNLAVGSGTLLLNTASTADMVWWNGSTFAPTGAVEGGSGTWSLAGGNFTNAASTVSGPWAGNGALAIFGGTAGTVTIAAGQTLSPGGLNFRTDGYVINGADAAAGLALTGPTGIDTAANVGATVNAAISGSGSLTKSGAGTLTLAGANTYAGETVVLGGTLVAAANDALGSGAAGVTVADGATLALGNGVTIGDALTLNGLGVGGTGALKLGRSATYQGAITLASDSRISADLASVFDIANDFDLSFTGITIGRGTISGTGNLTLESFSDLQLRAASTYTGTTTISANSLLSLSGGGTLGAGNVINNGSLLINRDSDSTIANAISGTGSLQVLADGTATALTGANSYEGETIIILGTLIAGSDTALGTAAQGTRVQGRATLGLQGGVAITGEALTLNGNGAGGLGNLRNFSGENSFTGPVTLGASSLIASDAGLLTLGTVALGANSLGVTGNGDLRIGGTVSGTGSLTKTGAGTLSLLAANSYTGVTLVSGGKLSLGGNGSLAGAVTNDASFDNLGLVSGLVTNSGVLFSGGRLAGGLVNAAGASASLAGTVNGTLDNRGAAVLVGNLGADIVTQAAGGSLDLAGFTATLGSLAGSGSVQLGTSGLLRVGSNNASTSFGGVIAGNGGLAKIGSGTLTLTGVNTYGGLTVVDAGTLAVAASGRIAGGGVINSATLTNAGTIAGQVTNNAGASFTNSGTLGAALVNAGTASNSGTITGVALNRGSLTSTGTLAGGLTNEASASVRGTVSGSVVNSGSVTLTGTTTGIVTLLQIGGSFDLAGFDTSIGTLLGSGSITLGAARLTTGSDGVNGLFGGVISGSGSLAKVGIGRLVLTGANTYTGGTTISGANAILQLGDGGETGSVTGSIVNNGALVVSRSNAYTLAGPISGTGVFVQDGTGTTTLTGSNSYSGGTLVNRGRLVGNTTSLQGLIQINANGTLEFAQGTLGGFGGSLAGTGLFEKTGAGLLTLTGNSNGFTGATTVRAGELRVTGSLAGSVVTVQSGASLSGTGVIGGLVAQSGSTIAPGTSPGTLGVAGNVTLQAGSTVAYEIRAVGASDLILASGTASLNGTAAFTNLSAANAYAFNSEIVVLQADGGRTGTFAAATGLAEFGNLYRLQLVYTGTQVRLRFAPNTLANIVGSTPLTANQRSVVSRIDGAVAAGYNPQALFNIYALPVAELPNAFDQLSGEVYASAAGVGIEQERLLREAVLGRAASVAAAGRDAPEAATGFGAWGQLFGGWGGGDADGNAAAFDSDRAGFATGIDYGRASENGSWRIGAFGMHITSDVTIDRLGSHAEVRQTGGGAYASLTSGAFSAAVGGYLAAVDLEGSRNIDLPTFKETLAGQTTGDARQVFAEASWTIPAGKSTIRPFVTGAIGSFKLDALRETGGAAALDMRSARYSTGSVTGGLAALVPAGKGLTFAGTLAARAQLGDRDPQANLALAAAPQQAFAVSGAQLDDVALAARLEADIDLGDNVNLSLGYTGLIGQTIQDHAATATLHVVF